MNKCLIISNQNIYDLININGLIKYLSNNYNFIYLFIKPENINDANIIFFGIDNLILTVVNNFKNINNINNFDKVIKLGIYNDNKIENYTIDNLSINYFELFYSILNINFEIKYKYEYLNRNVTNENKYYNKIIDKYKDGYIFYYNKNSDLIIDDYKMVYNPLDNYYKNDEYKIDYWINIGHDNIFDLLEIIENAEEIHIFDLDLYSLMPFLNLKKVKNKYIYHNNILIKNYHEKLKDFKFIYYN